MKMKNTKKIVSIIMAGILSFSPVMAADTNHQMKDQSKSTFAKVAGGMVLGCAVAIPTTLLITKHILTRKLYDDQGKLEKKIEQIENNLKDVKQERERLKTQLDQAQKHCKDLQAQATRNNSSMGALQNELERARQNVVDLRAQIKQKDYANFYLTHYLELSKVEIGNKNAECESYRRIVLELRQQLESRPNSTTKDPYLECLRGNLDFDTTMSKFAEKLQSIEWFDKFLKKIGAAPSSIDIKNLLKNIMLHGYNSTHYKDNEPAKRMLGAATTELYSRSGAVDTDLDIKFFAYLFLKIGINGDGIIPNQPSPSTSDHSTCDENDF